MSDIFREVDEEVRREQLKKLWERYQYLIVGVVLLVVVGVGGWRVYEWQQTRQAAEVGTHFEERHRAGRGRQARRGREGFRADRGRRHAGLSRAWRASARRPQLAQTDPTAAVEIYKQIAADSSVEQVLRDLAALRGGRRC